MRAHIEVDPAVPPKFCRARVLPFSLKDKVDASIDELLQKGIIRSIDHSKWAAPIVPVSKPDGSVRLCADYKQTVNRAAIVLQYPLPRQEELFAKLARCKIFAHLDLKAAYLQVTLDQESQQYTVINTHRGLFAFTRLPYGISAAPAIFQREMERLLKGIPNAAVYIDDIPAGGANTESYNRTIVAVAKRLNDAGMRLNCNKSFLAVPSIDFLGHRLDADGIHPLHSKVEAIQKAPEPTNLMELRSFLGLLRYYSPFLKNPSTKLAPLYALTNKKVPWTWTMEHSKHFNAAKSLLSAHSFLAHFDPTRPIILACDASPYGIACILSQVSEENRERPVNAVSRTLTPAEKRYAQIDREGLAIVFGVRRFHIYIYGRFFEIRTDHKPLLGYFGPDKGIPEHASPRVQRWSLFLSAYNYALKYYPASKQCHVDALSRLPLPECPEEEYVPEESVHLLRALDGRPFTVTELGDFTSTDEVLSRVRHYVQNGWPTSTSSDYTPFRQRLSELSVEDNCVLWGNRMVIPKNARISVLHMLHEGHPGMSRMKNLARSHVWWPGVDIAIEDYVRRCDDCQVSGCKITPYNFISWPQTESAWQRLHIDYAGPIEGKMILLVVDSFSKWIDAYITKSITSERTIELLRTSFATHGLPIVVVSDNARGFVSVEFKEFLKKNNVQHLNSPPRHPNSNGLVEKAVHTIKSGLTKQLAASLNTRLQRVLFQYRTTPHTTTNKSPAELLMRRKLRNSLAMLHPSQRVRSPREMERLVIKVPRYNINDPVFVLLEPEKRKAHWIPALIIGQNSPTIYELRLDDGRKFVRHVDHIKKRYTDDVLDVKIPDQLLVPTSGREPPDVPLTGNIDQQFNQESVPEIRTSGRLRRSPDRLNYQKLGGV